MLTVRATMTDLQNMQMKISISVAARGQVFLPLQRHRPLWRRSWKPPQVFSALMTAV